MSTSKEEKAYRYQKNCFQQYTIVDPDYFKLERDITKIRTMRVLSFLVQNNKEWNCVRLKRSEISDKLDIARPHISNAVKELISLGFIKEMKDKKGFIFNPYLVWNGSNSNHRSAQENW